MGHRSDLPDALGTIVQQEPWEGESVSLPHTIDVVIAVEDPDKEFGEQQERIHREYEKRGYFKDFSNKSQKSDKSPEPRQP